MKKILLSIGLVVISFFVITKIFNLKLEFDNRCGDYGQSDYVENIREEGEYCRVEITLRKINLVRATSFKEEWIIE